MMKVWTNCISRLPNMAACLVRLLDVLFAWLAVVVVSVVVWSGCVNLVTICVGWHCVYVTIVRTFEWRMLSVSSCGNA